MDDRQRAEWLKKREWVHQYICEEPLAADLLISLFNAVLDTGRPSLLHLSQLSSSSAEIDFLAFQGAIQRLRPLKDYADNKLLLTPGITDTLYWILFPIRPRSLAARLGSDFPLRHMSYKDFVSKHPHIQELVRAQRRQKPHCIFVLPSIPLFGDLDAEDEQDETEHRGEMERVPEDFDEEEFVERNGIDRNQTIEEFARRQIRTRRLISRYNATMAFHGSDLANFFSIMRRGLDTRFVRKGEGLFGDGIYLSCTPEIALNYVGWGNTWNHSTLGSRIGCLSVNQVVDHPDVLYGKRPSDEDKLPEEYLLVTNNDHVRVRYLFVYAEQENRFRSVQKLLLVLLLCTIIIFVFSSVIGVNVRWQVRRLVKHFVL